MRKRLCSILLTISLLASLFPASVLAVLRPDGRISSKTPSHDNCQAENAVPYGQEGGASAVIVTNFSHLQAALNDDAVTDIVLRPDEGTTTQWTVSEKLEVSRLVHISVAEGCQVTLKRADSMAQQLLSVSPAGQLILGDGEMTATEEGTYATEGRGGQLILDGGAVWNNGTSYTPGTDFSNPQGTEAICYDLEENSPTYGQQFRYTNSGLVIGASLVRNEGRLDLWDGVTLQNNVKKGDYGSAINSVSNSNLNMYGGLITHCLTTGTEDRGQGAVYIGNSGVNWQGKPTNQVATFTMYGGSIRNNAVTGRNSNDGGGVALDQAKMNLYAGEISYNHAGVHYRNDSTSGYAGDGGGVMVRCGSVLDMYGGSIHHNYAGGYGGGIVAWNGDVNLHGGEVTQNVGAFGGGIGIAADNSQTSYVHMYGGSVAYNEAISAIAGTGYGGGICAGSGNFQMGAHLDLQGGTIQQNKAAYGGGIAVYANGNKKAEADAVNTEVTMSGDFALTANSANYNGNGMYVTNTASTNLHTLLTMSGAARIDTNNPVYFNNLCTNQVPVHVSGTLTTAGTAAIFQFSNSFWESSPWDHYAHAAADMDIISFEGGQDIQENKFALESTAWYLGANKTDSALELQKFSDTPLYTIRNDTPVDVNGKKYFRLYTSLDEAFSEAADGDTLYIFYTTTIDTPAVVEKKHITLLAESNYSAANAGDKVQTGKENTFSIKPSSQGYQVVEGDFLKYVGTGNAAGISDGRYNISGTTANRADNGHYVLDVGPGSEYSTTYNVRNDYTITLASSLYLGENSRKSGGVSPAAEGAIVVKPGATLEIGKTASVTEGAGWLTFDGNLSYPTEGPMFQVSGEMTVHSGITIMNHANYS